MRKLVLWISIFFTASAAWAADTEQFVIRYDRVESNPIFGGLGDESGPISVLTDFYVDGAGTNGSPAFTLTGDHHKNFEAQNTAYFYVNGTKVRLCPKPVSTMVVRQLSCFSYEEYSVANMNEVKLASLRALAQRQSAGGAP